ncbi:MAG: tetratricopeptide repeat protein [Planctomycetota bacterium]
MYAALIADYRRTLGDTHCKTLVARYDHVEVVKESGRIDEADKVLQRLVDVTDGVAPPGHWFWWTVRGTYGDCLRAMDRFDDAERVLLEAHAKLNESLGRAHHRTSGISTQLTKLYEAWGRPEEAAKYAEPPALQPSDTQPANM